MKAFIFAPLAPAWLRTSAFALAVALTSIVSSQVSVANAQNTKQNPNKVQKFNKSQDKATVVRKSPPAKVAPKRKVQTAQKTTAAKKSIAKPSPRRSASAKSASASSVKTARNQSKPQTNAAARSVRVSYAQMAGLHTTSDALGLHSSVALVVDQETNEVLFSKNDHAVLPIASLTKLMTGLVIAEANLPMKERIRITQADVDTEKWSSSRLAVGTVLSRGELMHLALMSSENRAAHALGRTFPGGMNAFVKAMNERAVLTGMRDTRFVEPTGLSSANQSSASDLAVLAGMAYNEPMLRELSTSHGRAVAVGRKTLQYNNTNRLVKNPDWDIGLQKTGYISEAGRCLVMQAQVAGRNLIMVFLDSSGKFSRLGDAERVRKWVEQKSALHSSSWVQYEPLPS